MSDCCHNIARDNPLMGELCSEIEERYNHACADMNIQLPFTDFTAYPPLPKVLPRDHKTTIPEVMTTALEYARSEYVANFASGKPIGQAGSFIAFLQGKQLLPPWISMDTGSVANVLGHPSDGEHNIVSIIHRFQDRVTYSNEVKNISRNADQVFEDNEAGCLEWDYALYGVLLLTGINISFAEEVSRGLTNMFHTGLIIPSGEHDFFIDPADGPTTGVLATPFSELTAMAYYLSEQVLTGARDVEWLELAHALVPKDFHLAFSLWKWHDTHGNKEDAKLWIDKCNKLNPHFLPAEQIISDEI
jgi:hypothetical protein